MTGWISNAKRRWFPERQILLRQHGDVRYLALSTTRQLSVVAVALAGAIGLGALFALHPFMGWEVTMAYAPDKILKANGLQVAIDDSREAVGLLIETDDGRKVVYGATGAMLTALWTQLQDQIVEVPKRQQWQAHFVE